MRPRPTGTQTRLVRGYRVFGFRAVFIDLNILAFVRIGAGISGFSGGLLNQRQQLLLPVIIKSSNRSVRKSKGAIK